MAPITRIFCTVFDKNYLYQGLALYKSLSKNSPSFKLYCLTLDNESEGMLRQLNYPNLIVVGLNSLDQTLLEAARKHSTYAQFCWITQPILCQYVLSLAEQSVTYLEADSWFFSDPEAHFREIGDSSVAISPHVFSPQFRFHEKCAGKFCTQFNYFKNDAIGLACVAYWLSCCLEYRAEKPNYFPGQLSLDRWADKFPSTIVLGHRGGGVAPWNVQKYCVSREHEKVKIDESDLIFYHYHQVARLPNDSFFLGDYPLPAEALKWIYKPYLRDILDVERTVRGINPNYNFKRIKPPVPSFIPALFKFDFIALKSIIKHILRRMHGRYTVLSTQHILEID